MSGICSYVPCIKQSILSWIILCFAIVNVLFLSGERRAFGGFIAKFHKEFSNITLMELNWIGNSYLALGSMLSGLATTVILYFNRRYCLFQLIGATCILVSCVTSAFVPNPHWLFLTHTLLHGIGSSLVLAIVGLIVMEYFDSTHRYRILATSLLSGCSLGHVLFVALFAYVIQKLQWRLAFIVLGSIYFVVMALSAVFFKRQSEKHSKVGDAEFHFAVKKIKCLHVPLLILWLLDTILTSVVLNGLIFNLTDYLYRVQPDLVDSSLLTTLFVAGEGLSYLITVLVAAFTSSFLNNKCGFILIATSIVTALSLVGMEFTVSRIILQRLLCFITGLSIGFSNTILFPAAEELTKLPGHIAYSYSFVGIGLGMMLSPLLTAKVAELFQYKWFFLVQSCLIFIKVICLIVLKTLLFYYDKRDLNTDYEDISSEDDETNNEIEPQDDSLELLANISIDNS